MFGNKFGKSVSKSASWALAGFFIFACFAIPAQAGGNKGALAAGKHVITHQEMADAGHVFLIDALRGMPGVSVSGGGQPGTPHYVSLRGAPSRYTLVLIDGIEVNSPVVAGYRPSIQNAYSRLNTDPPPANPNVVAYSAIATPAARGGSYNFAHVLVSEVDRVEIIRGALAAQYGAGAGAGVINIVTAQSNKENEKRGAKFSLEGGSFETMSFGFGFTLAGENAIAKVRGAYYRSENEDISPGIGDIEEDEYTNQSLSMDVRASESFGDVALNVSYRQGEYELDPFEHYNLPGTNSPDPALEQTEEDVPTNLRKFASEAAFDSNHIQTQTNISLRYNGPVALGALSWSHGLGLFSSASRLESFYSDEEVADEDLNYNRYGGSYAVYMGNLKLKGGFEEESLGDSHFDNKLFYAASYTGKLAGIKYDFAGRQDERQSGDGGSDSSFHVALARKFGSFHLRGSYGTSIIEPTALDQRENEYYLSRQAAADGEAFDYDNVVGLEPETLTQFDVSLGFPLFWGTWADVTYFASESAEEPFYINMMDEEEMMDGEMMADADPPRDEDALHRALGDFDRTGIEATLSMPFTGLFGIFLPGTFTLNASMTHILSVEDKDGNEIADTDLPATNVPETSGAASLVWDISPATKVLVSASYDDERVAYTIDRDGVGGYVMLESYTLLGATISHELPSGMRIYVRGENLLEEEYETIDSYAGRGLGVFAGLASSF